MSFDQREWVNDIVTGAITGLVGGALSVMYVPDPSLVNSIGLGGMIGFVTGMLVLPLKWLLNCRPGPPCPPNRKDSQS
jgi:xanthine/uracil/vitamin C permease (AzgA family)